MNTRELTSTLTTILAELVDGAPEVGGFVLNRRDPGLLRSLDRLSADAASSNAHGGATIAAHADHLRYGLSLMNRWSAGENPFADADWSASWRIGAVTDDEWSRIRAALGDEAHRWLRALHEPRAVNELELNGVLGSIAHVAYHLGAMRQIDAALRGPKEGT